MTNPSESTERLSLSFFRVLVGCLIGGLIGFAPALAAAPGLWITLVALILLLRAPLMIVIGLGIVTKLLSLALVSVSYQVGVLLLDGPAQGFFQSLINAPFLALFGLEHYTTTGGLALGLVLGLVATVLVLKARKRTTAGRPKGVLRPLGLVVVVVLFGGLWFLQSAAAESILATQASSNLARVHGATVDISGIELDLGEGVLGVSDMAFADPKHLGLDLFRGVELRADLQNADLLRKRVHVEKLVVRRAQSGVERGVPGELFGKPAPPVVEAPAEGERSVGDYLKDWEVWRDRLSQAREWLEKAAPDEDTETSDEGVPLRSRVAEHLLEGAPTLLVDEFLVEGLEVAWVADEIFNISAHNLSSQPSLVTGAMDLVLASESDLVHLAMTLPSSGGESGVASDGRLDFALRDIPIDSITSMLKLGKGSVLRGGTFDLSLAGPWSTGKAGYIDLPLEVSMHDIELALSGSKTFPIKELKLPIHLRGPIDRPNVRLDAKALGDSLVAAGAAELANFVEAEKQRLMDAGKAKLQSELDDKLGGKLEELIGVPVELDVNDLEGTLENLEGAAKDKLETEGDALKAKLEDQGRALLGEEAEKLLGEEGAGLIDALEGGDLETVKEALTEEAKQKLADEAKQGLEDEAKKKLGDEAKKGLEKLFGGGKKPGGF